MPTPDYQGQLLPEPSGSAVSKVLPGLRKSNGNVKLAWSKTEDLPNWEGGRSAYEEILRKHLMPAIDALGADPVNITLDVKSVVESSARYGAGQLPEALKKDRCFALEQSLSAAHMTIVAMLEVFADKWPLPILRRFIGVRLWLYLFDTYLKQARQKERPESEHTVRRPANQEDNDDKHADPQIVFENIKPADCSGLDFESVLHEEHSEQQRALIGIDSILKDLVRQCDICRNHFAVGALSDPPITKVMCFRALYESQKGTLTQEEIAKKLGTNVVTLKKKFDECLKRVRNLKEEGNE